MTDLQELEDGLYSPYNKPYYNKPKITKPDNNLPMCPKCGTNDISQDEDGHYTCNICED